MNSNIFKLNLKDLSGAVLSGVIMSVLGYLGSLTSIYNVDWASLLNLAVLAAITSLLKSFGTTEDGKFLGGVQVK